MKRCSRCGEVKRLEEFTTNTRRPDGKQTFCNPCQRAAVRAHFSARLDYYLEKAARQRAVMDRRYKEVIRALKNLPCSRCGHAYHPAAMHFDHVRGDKLFNIGEGPRKTASQLRTEILKCDVLCANCHMDLTFRPRLVDAEEWLARRPKEILWSAP